MLKFHPIPAFMKTYTNLKKKILVRVFWLKYIFRIKFKIPILDLMLLSKNSVPFDGLYSSNAGVDQGYLERGFKCTKVWDSLC